MPDIRDVELRESALDDLKAIYTYLAERIGFERADAFVTRIEERCRSLAVFSERGRRRPDLGDEIRTLTFESQAIIAFLVSDRKVVILRVIHGSQNYNADTFL